MLDGYVGLSLVNQKGNTNTIKRKTGEKCHRVPYYEITCSVCSKDKELFTSPFLQTYGKFKSGKCCCGCSKSHVYTETQNKLRVKRVCKAKGLEFLGWSGVYSGVGTKITIKCKYSISKKSRIDTFLKSGACGCRECKRRSIISYSDKELLEEFLFIESLTRIDNKDGYSSPIWSYKCKVCSYDILTRNGLCSGVFKTTIPSLRAGNKPCRCGGNLILSKSQKEFMVDVAIKDNKLPYIRDGAIFRSGRKDKVPVKCKHGSSTLNYESIKTLNSRPRCCSVEGSNGFGYYPLRSEETDTLYLLKLTDNHETFYKIGRTFNLDKRVKELARYSGYSIGLIGFLKDNHEKVFSLEQRLLLNDLLSWKYTPFKTFGGSHECFSQNMLCDRFPLILLNDLTVL